jgi:CAAX protease family protein
MTDEPNRLANEERPATELAADALVLDERTGEELTSAHVLAATTGSELLPGPNWLSAVGWMIVFLIGQTFFVFVVSMALTMVLLAFGTQQQELVATITPWATASATAGSLLTAIVLTGTKFGSQAFRLLGLRRPDAAQLLVVVLLVAPLWIAGSGMGGLVDYWLPVQWDVQGDAIKQIATSGWLSIVIAGCLFPAVGEEIFFRGFLGRGLVARYGTVGGMILTSLAFGLFHVTPSQIAGTFVIGLGFQAVYLASKSLPAAMLLHFLGNFQVLTILSRQDQPSDQQLAEAARFSGFSWIIVLWSVLSVGLLGLVIYRLRTRWEFTTERHWQVPYTTGETPPVPALATRDPIWQHRWLIAIALIVWICFAVGFTRSGVFGF